MGFSCERKDEMYKEDSFKYHFRGWKALPATKSELYMIDKKLKSRETME
jgi:hypothetical protein